LFKTKKAGGNETASTASDKKAIMKKETQRQPSQKSAGKKRPLDPREFPLARDARGSAGREEIRSQTPMVSAPRQSRRPIESSS